MSSVGIPAQGEYKGYNFEIDDKYVVTIIGKAKGEKPNINEEIPIISGEVVTQGMVAQGTKVEIKVTSSIQNSSITNISATNGAILKTEISSTEKIFEVSENGTYYFNATAENGKSATTEVAVNNIIERPVISAKNITDSSFTIVVNNNYKEGLITEYKYYVGGTLKLAGTTEKEYKLTRLSDNTQYTNIYVEAYANRIKLTSQTTTIATRPEISEVVWTNNTSANRTIDGKTATYKNPIIPVGFSAINTGDATWNKTDGASSNWNDGLVIRNATDKNEFVWVPVDGRNVKYEKWCTTNVSYLDCKDVSSTSGLDIANNITKYGGFWVARYEAGLPTTINQTIADSATRNVSGKPLSISGAVPWNIIDWTHAKANAESMYVNDYVQSGLLNGTQWDTIVKWLQDSDFNIADSINWGNYKDNSINLRNGKYAYTSKDHGATWADATATTNGSNEKIKTGASNSTKIKNIYDIAGNMFEWTCEENLSNRVTRGGSCNSSGLTDFVTYRFSVDINNAWKQRWISYSALRQIKNW